VLGLGNDPVMGFNRRTMEAERKAKADAEVAARRAAERVLEWFDPLPGGLSLTEQHVLRKRAACEHTISCAPSLNRIAPLSKVGFSTTRFRPCSLVRDQPEKASSSNL
jgi:hypothetical protein